MMFGQHSKSRVLKMVLQVGLVINTFLDFVFDYNLRMSLMILIHGISEEQ